MNSPLRGMRFTVSFPATLCCRADTVFALACRPAGVTFAPVKVEEPAAGYPARIPVTPEVARRAMDFVRRFPGCFWFRDEEAPVRYRDDVELVISHLREYGDKTAWDAAKELRRCL